MLKKLQCLAKTLDDEIVRDCLCATGTLDDLYQNKNMISVVGGMGVQSYVHKDYRRPTSDIDLLVGRSLNYAEFKEFSKPVREYLQDNQYNVETGKTSGAYKLFVSSPETNDNLVIEFGRKNDKNFEKNRRHIERELNNARKKMIGDRYGTYSTLAPEDLILPKLSRCVNTANRRADLKNKVTTYEMPFIEEFIQRRLKNIQELRKNAIFNLGDPLIAEELRFVSDLYDIRILSELVGYNEDYLNEASKDWAALNEESSQKANILRILPKLQLNFH